MKYAKVAWKILELLMALGYDPRFKEAVDKMLDPVEEIFSEDKRVMKACLKIREILDVPDDDEE